jgi:hypothetical protein
MQTHVTVRKLVVKDYYHPMYPDSLRTVAILDLPAGAVDLDEVPQKLGEELDNAAITGYELKDSRTVEQMGAGFSGQEVLLTLATGAAEGAASVLIARLTEWCASKMSRRGKHSKEVEPSVERATRFIERYFNPLGPLEVIEIDVSNEQARLVLQDDGENRFVVETKGGPHSIVARREPVPNEPDFAEIDRRSVS